MGPEVRLKSARRCQGKHKHQGYRHIKASIENQRSVGDSEVIQTFFQFLGISNWELFVRFGSSHIFHTHADSLTVIALMSTFITGIKFIDFRLLFYIVIIQLITIGFTILIPLAFLNKGIQFVPTCQSRIVRSSKNSSVCEPPPLPPPPATPPQT